MAQVEIVFALPDSATCLFVELSEETNVQQAIEKSNIFEKCPEIDQNNLKVGIWNRVCKLNTIVKDGDRIEIYRPLIADPKDARRKRAEKAKEEGRADKITGGRSKR